MRAPLPPVLRFLILFPPVFCPFPLHLGCQEVLAGMLGRCLPRAL